MTGLDLLLLPILLSSVFVFLASWMIHMMPLWHKNDMPKYADQDKVMDALRPLNIPPGEYMIPRADNMKAMKSQEFLDKLKKGPVLMMNVFPNRPFNMNKSLVLWFVYTVVIGIFAAYVSGRALAPGATYLQAFRFAGVASFLGYAGALWPLSIWYQVPMSRAMKGTFDGLIYALLTGGTFGWLWPQIAAM